MTTETQSTSRPLGAPRVLAGKAHLASAALLVVAAAAVYGPAIGHAFLKTWDDRTYVVANPLLTDPSWRGVLAAFAKPYFYNYAPLHLLSYMADAVVWGIRPAPFIACNVALHAACGVLLYALLVRLSFRPLAAFAAALLFVVHPVQVESVVWISQRKTVLSGFFFLAALYAYVRSADPSEPERRRRVAWTVALVAFVLALLSKATTVVFPAVALAYDLCLAPRTKRVSRLVAEKLPFAAAAGAVALVTVWSQTPEIGGGTTGWHGGSPLSTAFTMMPVFAQYVGMVLWPTSLSPVYATVIRTRPDAAVLAGALLLVAIVWVAVACRRRRPTVTFFLLTFLAGLLPVSQVVPIVTLINDRYLYLSMIGAAPLLVELAGVAAARLPGAWRRVPAALLVLLVARDAAAAVRQVPVWADDHALWSYAMEVQPASAKAHFQYAHAMELEARFGEAVRGYEEGLRLQDAASERYFLGQLQARLGAPQRAIPNLRRAIELSPQFWDARTALGLALLQTGAIDAAIEQYEDALRVRPGVARTHNDAAIAYAMRGRIDPAIAHFERAVQLEPRDAEYRFNLGTAYARSGRAPQAMEQLQQAVRLAPGDARFARALAEVSGAR